MAEGKWLDAPREARRERGAKEAEGRKMKVFQHMRVSTGVKQRKHTGQA